MSSPIVSVLEPHLPAHRATWTGRLSRRTWSYMYVSPHLAVLGCSRLFMAVSGCSDSLMVNVASVAQREESMSEDALVTSSNYCPTRPQGTSGKNTTRDFLMLHSVMLTNIQGQSCWVLDEFPPIVFRKKGKLGAYAMKRVAAGAHLPTPWLFQPAKRPDDTADYCLGTRR